MGRIIWMGKKSAGTYGLSKERRARISSHLCIGIEVVDIVCAVKICDELVSQSLNSGVDRQNDLETQINTKIVQQNQPQNKNKHKANK